MKIAFMLATRGNPRRASAVIECARSLASGDHEIEYFAGIDADDVQTQTYFNMQQQGVVKSIGGRPLGVGDVWNRMVVQSHADVYCPFPDDSWIATPNWDGVIAAIYDAVDRKELMVLGWNDLANQGQMTLPIVSREWLTLTGGVLYDKRFPFWFYDTCVAETWSFITGKNVPLVSQLTLAAKKGFTQRMRDLPFWWDFYVATRPERLQHAASIRERLGLTLTPHELARVVGGWLTRDVAGRASAIEIEQKLSAERIAGSKPDAGYIHAKEIAEAYMRAHQFRPLVVEVRQLNQGSEVS